MDFKGFILLLSASQGLLLSIALFVSAFFRKWRNLFLGLIILLISIEVLNVWAMGIQYHSQSNIFPFWCLSSYFIFPAAVFLFIRFNLSPERSKNKKWWILFLPAFFQIVISFYSFYSNLYFGTNISLRSYFIWSIYTDYLPPVVTIFTLVFLGKDIYLYYKNHQENLQHLGYHFKKIVAFYLLFTFITILWILDVFLYVPVFGATTIILCVFLYFLALLSWLYPHLYTTPNLGKVSPPIKKSPVIEYPISDYQKIIHHFEKEKLYLNPELTLHTAAGQLAIPPRVLSSLINHHEQKDFRMFLNSYRIKEVITKVEQGELHKKTLLAIALESGFNAKSTFNKVFKDLLGKSPTEYFSSLKK